MDPELLVMAVLGVFGLVGRLRRGSHDPSASGRIARRAATVTVGPAVRGVRQLPLFGGAGAWALFGIGTIVGETVGEVMDGASAAADWLAEPLRGKRGRGETGTSADRLDVGRDPSNATSRSRPRQSVDSTSAASAAKRGRSSSATTPISDRTKLVTKRGTKEASAAAKRATKATTTSAAVKKVATPTRKTSRAPKAQ